MVSVWLMSGVVAPLATVNCWRRGCGHRAEALALGRLARAASALAKGINLADEFKTNPFCKPFEKVLAALGEEKACINWLANAYKGNADMRKRYERALAAKVPATVRHTIKIEVAP